MTAQPPATPPGGSPPVSTTPRSPATADELAGADGQWTLAACDEAALNRLGDLIALKLRVGDVVALRGDLGAGKTTLARAILRALIGDPGAEVPSPTFPILQDYQTARLAIRHYDFYRLSGADEVAELGFDEALETGAALVEWPERAEQALPIERIDIALVESQADASCRDITLSATGRAAPRLARLRAVAQFLSANGPAGAWHDAHIGYLQGDASPRAYARLVAAPDTGPPKPTRQPATAILMDAPRQPDGPPVRDGLPYSRIAHIAEHVGPFLTMAEYLTAAGLSAPAILAAAPDDGLLLVEDLGDTTFREALASGVTQAELWQAALEPLRHLYGHPLPPGLPAYDRRALTIEIELLVDWYWPWAKKAPAPASSRAAFANVWAPLIAAVAVDTTNASGRRAALVLRDYHSPNLMWLPDRDGARRVGIIDFQDAVAGHPAYDLVSLAQDARIDVPANLEADLIERHCRALATRDAAFDEAAFRTAYAILGAQRATKILGIFARLSQRDGKHGYLAHMPRIWGYLMRNLAHPSLAALAEWYDQSFEPAERGAPATASTSPEHS